MSSLAELENKATRLEALAVIVRMAKMGEAKYGIEGETVDRAWDYVLADLENLATDVREAADSLRSGRAVRLVPGG